MKIHFSAIVALCVSSPLLAQSEQPKFPQTQVEWTAEVAPEWGSDSPLLLDERTDATTTSLQIKVTHKFSEDLVLVVNAGPSARLDSDGDDKKGASSFFGTSAELGLAADEHFTIYGGVGYKAKFDDLFGDDRPDERIYDAGIKFGQTILVIGDKPSTTFKARAFYRLTDSTNDAKDVEMIQARLNWDNPIKSWGLFSLEGSLSRRWFQNEDAVAGYKERADDLAMSAGIDFRPIFRTWFRDNRDNPLIQKVRFGLGYFKSDSNIGANSDDGTFSPVVTVAIGRRF